MSTKRIRRRPFIDFFYRMGILNKRESNKVRLEVSHNPFTHNFTIFRRKNLIQLSQCDTKIFTRFCSLPPSLFHIDFLPHSTVNVCNGCVQPTLQCDFLGRQTSINDCLSRNIDDLTNSPSTSTLSLSKAIFFFFVIYLFVSDAYRSMKFWCANITCSFFMCSSKSQIIVNTLYLYIECIFRVYYDVYVSEIYALVDNQQGILKFVRIKIQHQNTKKIVI